jgi:MFS family permease
MLKFVAAVAALTVMLMSATQVEERPVAVTAKSKIDINMRQFPKPYWKYLLATALFGIGNSSNAFLILQTKDIGASLTMTILIYAGFNLVAALISYPAGFLSDKLGRRNILLLAFVIFLVTYLSFALTRNVALIAVLFILYGLFQGIFRSVGKALASDYVPEQLRASGIGWYNTTVGLFGLVASLVAGLLWDQVGHAAVFLFGAGFAVVGGIALLALVPENTRYDVTTGR